MPLFSILHAQEETAPHGSASQANNPLANMTALNVHNYYIPKLTNTPAGAYLNSSWLRFAKPLANGKFIFRISAPLSTVALPEANGNIRTVNGLGDINAFMAYSFVSNATSTIGAGPLLTVPTAAENELGTGKWQAGIAVVAFIAKSPAFQFGSLITWQASIAGDDERQQTSNGAIQPFYFWQLGKGTYLRGSPAWLFDFKADQYSIPLGLGIGKIVPMGKTVFNLFVEPQYTMLHKGTQPQLQVFTGINIQLIKS